jgi:hypothetical protein
MREAEVVAVRTNDHQATPGGYAPNVPEQLHRRPIGPVQVVQNDDDGICVELEQEPRERIVSAQTSLVRRKYRRLLDAGKEFAELRNELRKLGRKGAQLSAKFSGPG